MSQNGKGDSPRNCFSKEFKENYDQIQWKTSSRNAQGTDRQEKQKNSAQATASNLVH